MTTNQAEIIVDETAEQEVPTRASNPAIDKLIVAGGYPTSTKVTVRKINGDKVAILNGYNYFAVEPNRFAQITVKNLADGGAAVVGSNGLQGSAVADVELARFGNRFIAESAHAKLCGTTSMSWLRWPRRVVMAIGTISVLMFLWPSHGGAATQLAQQMPRPTVSGPVASAQLAQLAQAGVQLPGVTAASAAPIGASSMVQTPDGLKFSPRLEAPNVPEVALNCDAK